MNTVCKEYISDAKKFFPVMGRKERDYLRKVSGDIEDFIEVENITTKSELVEKYHQPYEVANNYYATFFDTELIIKRIKISKYIKVFVSIFIAVILIGFSFYMYAWNSHLNVALSEEMVGRNDVLFDDSKQEEKQYTIHNEIKSNDYNDDLSNGEEIIQSEEIIE